MKNASHEPPARVLRSLNLSLDVLEAIADSETAHGVSRVAIRLGMSKAAAHAILTNLEARGYIERRDGTRGYQLGHRTWELGIAAGELIELSRISHEHLLALTALTGESSQLAEYSAPGEVLYLDRAVSPNPVQTCVRRGGRAPAWCVATGRALLAHQSAEEIETVCRAPLIAYTPQTIVDPEKLRTELENVRRTGFALNPGEYRGEIIGIAAPIRSHTGAVVAAIGVSGPAYRFDTTLAAAFASEVVATADAISRKLGFVVAARLSARAG